MCFLSIRTLTAAHVFFMRNGFEMLGVHTSAIPAKMIYLEPERNFTNEYFVAIPMSYSRFSFIVDDAISCR
jgi:hypothetical protein